MRQETSVTASPGGPEQTGAFPAIADYALIGNCRGCALIGRDGAVEWACIGRFDARPVFARVLDRERGGWFRVAPAGEHRAERAYLDRTNVLETTFHAEGGTVTVTDFLPLRADPGTPGASVVDPPEGLLLRIVRGIAGSVDMLLELRPRFEYGLTTPLARPAGDGVVTFEGGPEALLLQTELGVPTIDDDVAGCRAAATVREGDVLTIAVAVGAAGRLGVPRLDRDGLLRRERETIAFWRDWDAATRYAGPYEEPVRRSALVLKALTYEPSGAVVAAPTTSLPEEIGGERNWDYRFCWLRDTSALLAGLTGVGHLHEARRFADWLVRAAAGRAGELQIMYGIDGERMLTEAELPWLSGYRGSRPVRIGNGAWDQFQLDVYGELMTAAHLVAEATMAAGGTVDRSRAAFFAEVVETALERVGDPDEGIWEVRGGRQHFVFSKVMAWVAVDRGIRLAEAGGAPAVDLARWRAARDEIRAAIEAQGVDPRTGAFRQAYGSDALDASTLQAVLQGFVAPDDPRALATIDEVERGLSREGHVYRYLSADGLSGEEGAFVFCTLWLAAAEAYAGRAPAARRRLEAVLERANDVGLLAEEIDPRTGEMLGNFPQAFSHIGVISAALAIARAEAGERRPLTA